jgi:hypothetical protein
LPLFQTERLVEQGIAVRARDRGALARERKRNLLICMVSIVSGDELLAPHGEHCLPEPLGAKEPAPLELRDLR